MYKIILYIFCFCFQFNLLDQVDQKVAGNVGVPESFLARKVSGQSVKKVTFFFINILMVMWLCTMNCPFSTQMLYLC